jgi:hypothetical protein
MKRFAAAVSLLVFAAVAPAQAATRIGFVDPALPKAPTARNAAALSFAQSQGVAVRIAWQPTGGWRAADGTVHAPEEFDVVWFHQGDDLALAKLDEAAGADLLAWLEEGGTLLVSGAAGRLLNDLGIEATPLRVLGATEVACVSGIRPLPQHRAHPAFAGFDTPRSIMLTSKGSNALADFHGTAGPHGNLLANGNSAGERPLVEYAVGAGRVVFVGWRLPDFTTAGDAHRPNLERLFGNLLRYLADQNRNHARMVAPPGKTRYARLMGVPLLLAGKPVDLSADAITSETAVSVQSDTDVREARVVAGRVTLKARGLTLTAREHPVTRFVAARRAEQEAVERKDREALAGLRVLRPEVRQLPGPLKPLAATDVEQSVLLGRSPFMAPGEGTGDITPVYEPLEDGGFWIKNSPRKLNRPIVHGQNRLWTGDVPLFRMDTVTGNGSYARDERVFPLWPRPDAQVGNVNPSMGTLRLGIPGPKGATRWLDEQPGITATFRPGYTEYELAGARITVAPALDFHGLVCRVEFDRDTPLVWQYGGMWWTASEANANRVEIVSGVARITEPNLPHGLVLIACDADGQTRAIAAPFGQQAEFTTAKPRRVYHIVAAWGVTEYDQQRARTTLARLDTPNAAAWPEKRDALKRLWFDCYVGRALEPEQNLRTLRAAPAEQLRRTQDFWDRRRAEFQIHTPDAHLNALINWARAVSEYHRQGPGLVLGGQIWQMYSHISTGWYGKQWAGDHAAIEECLRFYAAMQGETGFVRWISPSLVAFNAENNTPYWVDQVWRHYTWTGDRQFVRDMWPAVRKAVAWMRSVNDPDDDGLFRDAYEYWNCDSNGKGPKAATPSAMAWAMLDRAARMAAVVGDAQAGAEYRRLADRTRTAVFRELWNANKGRLGSIGADGFWRGHPQTWEEYLAVNAGLLDAAQARSAMRWIAGHYGFEPQPGVRLLACSDWWPIRWSCQWVPTGDTCLAVLAGMKGGDADLWWPYLKTVVGSAFRSECPGINMGISNAGAGGGDREDVDSDDPHAHVAVRGLFGIEPAIDQGRLDICPAFPSAWREASIRTPDVSYQWRRDAQQATFRIRTPRPVVKRVRACLGGEEMVTPAECESTVTIRLGNESSIPSTKPSPLVAEVRTAAGDFAGPDRRQESVGSPANSPAPSPLAPLPQGERGGIRPPANVKGQLLDPTQPPTILAEQQPPETPKPLSAAEHRRLVLFDIAPACNVTSEEFVATRFIFDHADRPSPMGSWWGNPSLVQPPAPRVVTASHGVVFLTAGRPRPGLGPTPKNLLAVSSWRPQPLPGGVELPVRLRCQRLWLLLQCYVHPMKNYLANGEVVLRYGKQAVTALVPPLNLDCYFQHFSRQGVPVPLGQLGPWPTGWTPIHRGLSQAHADALAIDCDTTRVLQSVQLRATCSEGALGLVGITALTPETSK